MLGNGVSYTHTHPHDPDQEERVQPQHEEDGHDVDVLHVVGHHEGAVVDEQLLEVKLSRFVMRLFESAD